jgi:hypothetical protein
MSRTIIVLEEADQELLEAMNWYEAKRPGLGSEFLAAVDESLNRLAESPKAVPFDGNGGSCEGIKVEVKVWRPTGTSAAFGKDVGSTPALTPHASSLKPPLTAP